MNEEVLRGTLSEIRENFARRDRILGEFVLVIGSAADEAERIGGGDDVEPAADD
jgi:16S rRNA C1402 (ribose-2'-O) methylase RsmI